MKAADAALEYLETMKERDSGKASCEVVEFFSQSKLLSGFNVYSFSACIDVKSLLVVYSLF